ncbi:MAG: glycosyltransferase family 2 protein [Verrucomicrobia bacterium]|nr:glycosyltransferase family 2 protein [Verrucomicrobiota bacterium]
MNDFPDFPDSPAELKGADSAFRARDLSLGPLRSESAPSGAPTASVPFLSQGAPWGRPEADGSPPRPNRAWRPEAQETSVSELKPLTVSIVIPVYNSEATIGRLCEQLLAELASFWRLQIVLVDDGSADQSAAVCRRLHERHPDSVSCVLLARNFGEHNAVMAGLNYAEGDYCVIMDDDFQNPPSEVHRLVEEAAQGYDVVYVRYEVKQHGLWRNLGSRLHNWMATYALHKPRDLYLSSFKVLSRFVVRQVVQYTGPDPYLDAIVLRTTRKIGVVAAQHHEREKGRSNYTLLKLFALWGNMIVAFSLYPLRLMVIYGCVMALLGLAYGAYTILAWLVPAWSDPDSYQKLSASMWFFRGSTLLALGILGEYVGRIFMRLNQAPQFIVRELLPRRRQRPALGVRPYPTERPEVAAPPSCIPASASLAAAGSRTGEVLAEGARW